MQTPMNINWYFMPALQFLPLCYLSLENFTQTEYILAVRQHFYTHSRKNAEAKSANATQLRSPQSGERIGMSFWMRVSKRNVIPCSFSLPGSHTRHTDRQRTQNNRLRTDVRSGVMNFEWYSEMSVFSQRICNWNVQSEMRRIEASPFIQPIFFTSCDRARIWIYSVHPLFLFASNERRAPYFMMIIIRVIACMQKHTHMQELLLISKPPVFRQSMSSHFRIILIRIWRTFLVEIHQKNSCSVSDSYCDVLQCLLERKIGSGTHIPMAAHIRVRANPTSWWNANRCNSRECRKLSITQDGEFRYAKLHELGWLTTWNMIDIRVVIAFDKLYSYLLEVSTTNRDKFCQ